MSKKVPCYLYYTVCYTEQEIKEGHIRSHRMVPFYEQIKM